MSSSKATDRVPAEAAGSTTDTLEGVLDSLAAAERPKAKGSRWRYEAGDRLVLRVDEVGEVDGKFGVRTFVKGQVEGTVSTENGGEVLTPGMTRIFYADAAAARAWVEADKPQVGDLVAVVYLGKDDGGHDVRGKVVERGEGRDDIPF